MTSLRERIAGADFTLRGLHAEPAERNVGAAYKAVWRFAHAERLSYKKSFLPAEQDRPDVARERGRWKARQGSVDIKQLVFIDHTGAKTNMGPLRGWSLCGHRLKAKIPFGHWNTMTFIAALWHDRIDAPWMIDGPVNAEMFLRYVETQLVPTLGTGDIVIMDNLSSHKGPAVRAAIRATGARLLFLPAYSPDLNPIEQLCANSPPASPTGRACRSLKPAPLKHALRKAAARTLEATWTQIGILLGKFTPQECSHYLLNSAYCAT